jgi:hypothetical protein
MNVKFQLPTLPKAMPITPNRKNVRFSHPMKPAMKGMKNLTLMSVMLQLKIDHFQVSNSRFDISPQKRHAESNLRFAHSKVGQNERRENGEVQLGEIRCNLNDQRPRNPRKNFSPIVIPIMIFR